MKFKNSVSIDSALGWAGTAAIILATCIRAGDISNLFDLIFTNIGCLLWATAAYRCKNNALLTVNAFSIIIVTAGIVRHFF